MGALNSEGEELLVRSRFRKYSGEGEDAGFIESLAEVFVISLTQGGPWNSVQHSYGCNVNRFGRVNLFRDWRPERFPQLGEFDSEARPRADFGEGSPGALDGVENTFVNSFSRPKVNLVGFFCCQLNLDWWSSFHSRV